MTFRTALTMLILLVAAHSDAQCLSGDCKAGQGRMDMGYAIYEGSFKDEQPDGTGTMDYGGGDKYTGGWRKGKEEGAGTLYKKGAATTVFYKAGVLQEAPRRQEVVGSNGDWKEKVPGCTTGDCYDGYGEISFMSGNSYKGSFKDGVKSGYGEMRFAGGHVLKATFAVNDPVSGTFWYDDVQTLFTGTFNADGTPKDGTYTSPGMDAIVDVAAGRVISERHPGRDSINAEAAKHAREYGRCGYCEGKGQYLHTSYSSIHSERSSYVSYGVETVTYKQSGGFAQNMVTCPKCHGTGELKR